MLGQDSVIEIKDLKMYYQVMNKGWVRAVDGVSLYAYKNKSLGIVGESGCGKSSLALTILRLLPLNAKIFSGSILMDGTDILKLSEKNFRKNIGWKRISIIFQGAMNALNPMLTIGEQISETIMIHENISKKEAQSRTENLLRMVGIEVSRAKYYPFEFSGGMKQRVMIAMALALNPNLVIADEPTTALDVIVQSQVLRLMRDLQEKLGLSLMLISHDISLVFSVSDNVAIMYAGKIVEFGPASEIYHASMHPYTYFLLKSVPDIRAEKRPLGFIGGAPPNLLNPPSGCRFHPRCAFAADICMKEEPLLKFKRPGHCVACHKADELEGNLHG